MTTLAGLGLTYVLPEQYQSTALVLVRPFEDIKFSASGGDKKEIPDFPVTLSAPVDAPSKTYMEVIRSPAVAAKIVDALQLQVEQPAVHDSWFAAIRDGIKIWIKNTIRTVRNYTKYGRDIAVSPFDQAVEDVSDNLTVSGRKDTYAFDITYRSGDPKQAAAVANMAAEIFLEQSSEAYRSESARAREFTEMQLDESRKTLDRAREAILAYKRSGETFDLAAEYDEKLKGAADLENTLAKTRGRLAGLKTRAYGKAGPNVIEQEAEITELQQQIQALRIDLATYPQKEIRLNAIKLTEHLAEQSYEFFLKQNEQARVKESSTVSEIQIVSRAVPGLYPVKPLKFMYAGLSFGTALIVAAAWLLFKESLYPRVRTARDLDQEDGTPMLGKIPLLRESRSSVGA